MLEMRPAQIFFYALCMRALIFDEIHSSRAATEGLDSQRSRAGKEIEHACIDDKLSEYVEEHGAHAIARGPKVAARRREQALSLAYAGNHAHD